MLPQPHSLSNLGCWLPWPVSRPCPTRPGVESRILGTQLGQILWQCHFYPSLIHTYSFQKLDSPTPTTDTKPGAQPAWPTLCLPQETSGGER